jgi:hypothetical protein
MCTSATVVPNSLYMSGSGPEVRPSAARVALITPLSDRMVIHAKVRTTMPVSIGAITAMSKRA